MVTYYIGLGGLGCSIVMQHKSINKNTDNKYVCFDCDRKICEFCEANCDIKYHFMIPPGFRIGRNNTYEYGTGGFPAVGKEMFKYAAYSGRMNGLFDGITENEVKLVFVTTTFGGFGSAVAYDMVEYINSQINRNGRLHTIRNLMIGLPPENYYDLIPKDKTMLTMYEFNTVNFLDEYRLYDGKKSFLFPDIDMYMPHSAAIRREEYYKFLDYDIGSLSEIDIKRRYEQSRLATNKTLTGDVFISYSSKDQSIANMLKDTLQKNGISTWIATENINAGSYAKQIIKGIRSAKIFAVIISRNSRGSNHVLSEIDHAFNRLKDGIKIMPIIIDDSELSDECSYYLSRQEAFFGNIPPVKIKIDEFAQKIIAELE